MRESITYQEILEEGREEGEGIGSLKEARRMLLKAGVRRLGPVSADIEARVAAVESVEILETLIERVFDVESWDDLLK